MDSVLITAIICATVILICLINRGGNRHGKS